ncbi:MAG: ABC transporter permease [Chloroflexi bacterium]|nr:MAG: ABC transporter permease [Chloroflexota bacterium]
MMRRVSVRVPTLAFVLSSLVLLALMGTILVLGLSIDQRWITGIYLIGRPPGTEQWQLPPFGPLSHLEVYARGGGRLGGIHTYLLGSDAGGRDLLALIARGSLPSLALVTVAVLGRLLVGIIAGIAMGLGSTTVRTISRGMGRWVAGFPYLALAIIVVQALSPESRFGAFVVAMALVGWRDVAEVTAEHVEAVMVQPYATAAKALGSEGLTFFRRHVLPHLKPALAIEAPFQASAVLVLLAELGYLGVFLGKATLLFATGARGQGSVVTATLAQPELGQLLSDARSYILQEQWVPVLIPALIIGLLALAFELIGYALRGRADPRR